MDKTYYSQLTTTTHLSSPASGVMILLNLLLKRLWERSNLRLHFQIQREKETEYSLCKVMQIAQEMDNVQRAT
jgi:hypothetical protein